mgnify:CR=1 FL=1
MARKLHGLRYARPEAHELLKFISEELHTLSFDECLNFFNDFRQATQHPMDYAFLAANDRFFLLSGVLNRRAAGLRGPQSGPTGPFRGRGAQDLRHLGPVLYEE